jgi:hypothetical protein
MQVVAVDLRTKMWSSQNSQKRGPDVHRDDVKTIAESFSRRFMGQNTSPKIDERNAEELQ